MSNITLQLDGDALREATVQAMLGVLSPEVRTKVLENAIQATLRPSTNSWDRGKSPLEVAFEQAINSVAREEALRLVKEDASIRTRMVELMRSTADRLLNDNNEKLADAIAAAFASAMKKN